MKKKAFIYICLLMTMLNLIGCYHQSTKIRRSTNTDTVKSELERPYPLNANFQVLTDSLWLLSYPLTDSILIKKNDELVVAEFSVHAQDSIDSIWVKVARDQESIGWIRESELLEQIIPTDPISHFIYLFSSSRVLFFLLIPSVFILWWVIRRYRKEPIRFIWLNDIDSVFPILLSWLLALTATLYNSIQYFTPDAWLRYYFSPTLSPFEVEGLISFFLMGVWLCLLAGIALLDELFRITTKELGFFYLIGFVSASMLIYILFTCVWVYLAYLLFILFTFWCFYLFKKAGPRKLSCGNCGSIIEQRGICPRCGALNK